MKTLQVLLSTYNGERYLPQLLDSVLGQDYRPMCILVRDDGSTDGTQQILRSYQAQYENIKFLTGENLGFASSFLKLIEHSAAHASYFAFCDQDDVWMQGKMSRAVRCLDELTEFKPAAYASRQLLTDAALNPIGLSEFPLRPAGFGNALVENVMTGCTVVFNRSTRDALLPSVNKRVMFHDWWLYLVVTALGSVVIDDYAGIQYRQHDSNAIGNKTSWIDQWLARWQRFFRGRPLLANQAAQFLTAYGDNIPEFARELATLLVAAKTDVRARMRLAFDTRVYRQRTTDDLILRGLILLNRL